LDNKDRKLLHYTTASNNTYVLGYSSTLFMLTDLKTMG